MDTRFYEKLLLEIRERRSEFSERLLKGSFSSLEEYKFIVGKFQGLREAEELLVDLFKQVNSIEIGENGYDRVI